MDNDTREIQLTQGRVCIVDAADYAWLSRDLWHTNRSGYAMRARKKSDNWTSKMILMHRLIMGNPPEMTIDHINRDKLDNRRSNLRVVTQSCNASIANRRNPRRSILPPKGKRRRYWQEGLNLPPHGPEGYYIWLTPTDRAIVDKDDYAALSKHNWYLGCGKDQGKWRGALRTDKNKKNISMHGQILGLSPGHIIKHINGNTLDNRKENLRLVTFRDAARSQRKESKEKNGGFIGVFRRGQRFYAHIRVNSKTHHLGVFGDAKSAAIHRDRAAFLMHGEVAVLNFPELRAEKIA